CLDRATGKTIWQKTVHSQIPHSGTHPDGTQASASPIVDGQHIYASFGSFGIYCLDMQGNVKWNVDLGDQTTRNSFGEGSSPALHGETLIVNWDHEEKDFIVALDKKTGKELWRKDRDEPTNWTTPLIVEVADKPQVIVPGTSKCISYDLKTGETVWTCGGLTQNVIPSPVYHDGVVYLMSGFRGSALKAIKLADAKGDLSEKKDAFVFETSEQKTPYVPSSLLYQGCLYFFDNNKAVLTNLDAKTGQENFGRERIEGMQQVYASPIGANGFVYLCGRDGETVVIKAGPKLEIVATNKLDDGFDASPVAVGDQLLLRGREHLYCVAP
ncbi:MAG: PQQ-binding-like beta-propeller repeat protein, partial [Phycisphaerae bacterium]